MPSLESRVSYLLFKLHAVDCRVLGMHVLHNYIVQGILDPAFVLRGREGGFTSPGRGGL